MAAPIVVVSKKDGEIRICGDFKVSINPVLHPQVYPLPTPEEMFSTLATGESHTKLDLARAYKQMKVRKECQPLLTINTHCGLFQYTRLPFGITSAPSLWDRAMAQVLSGLPGVVCYIDDILVNGHTRAEHANNLRAVLQRIREYGLRLKKSKCQFFTKELEFLEHVISPEGVKPTKSHVTSILEAPTPTNKQGTHHTHPHRQFAVSSQYTRNTQRASWSILNNAIYNYHAHGYKYITYIQ